MTVHDLSVRFALAQRRVDAFVRAHPIGFRALFLLTATLLCVWVYKPALNRFFAADQISYLAELKGDRSLSAGLAHLDYGRSRVYWKGDEALFRPGLFLLLAVEHKLFGVDHVRWNIANLVLHLLCLYLLFELLLTYRHSVAAATTALLFSVLHASMESVLWNHLGGYLLGYALLLGGLIILRRGWHRTADDAARVRLAVAFGACLLGAMLFHEIAVVSTPLLLAYLVWRGWRTHRRRCLVWCAAVLAPVLLFAAMYIPRSIGLERWMWVSGGMSSPVTGVGQVLSALVGWALSTFNPSGRVLLQMPFTRFSETWTGRYLAWSIAEFALPLSLLAGWIRWCRRRKMPRSLLELALPVGILLAYLVLNCIGRGYATHVLYYSYFMSLFAFVALFASMRATRLVARTLAAVTVVSVILVVNNAVLTHADARRIGAANESVTTYMRQVSEFMAAHQDEPGFSFRTDERTPASVDPPWTLIEGYPDQPTAVTMTRFSELYYCKWRADNARYVLSVDQSMALAPPRLKVVRTD